MKLVVLVHGAWHGPWCWERVIPGLDAAGVPWNAPDLPSGAAAAEGAALVEDVRLVDQLLDELPGEQPVVLVGHSRGGLVISAAGTHDRVDHLVYLCAFLLEPGEGTASIVSDTVLPILDVVETPVGPLSTPRRDVAGPIFYNDCSAEDTAWACDRLRPMYMGGEPVEPPRVAWRTKPSTYVVCARDAGIPPEHQRVMATRATHVMEWDTGHSPFLNQPHLITDLLVDLAAG